MKYTIFVATLVVATLMASCSSVRPVLEEKVLDDRVITLVVDSAAVRKGSIRPISPPTLMVVLPESYASHPERRYPVVYALHGFGDGVASMISALKDPLTEGARSGACPEVILVSVDGTNSLGGSFYVNSAATGDWMDWVTREVVALVDSRYRTIPSPSGRMLAGYSMGGFGAWNIALQNPGTFASAWASCPGAWDKDGLTDTLAGWGSIYRVAYGAALAPDTSAPAPHARVPTLDNSPGDLELRALWERGFGGISTKLERYAGQDKHLLGLRFDYGEADGYRWIPKGTVAIAAAMSAAGLPVEIEGWPAGHRITGEMLEKGFLPFVNRIFGSYR